MAKDDSKQQTPKADKDDALSAGGDKSAVKQQNQTAATESGETSNAPLDGKVVKRNQNRQGNRPELPRPEVNALHVVEEDVYEEFYAANSDRPLYRLLFPRGTVVLKAEYDAAVSGEQNMQGVGDVTQQVVGGEGRVGGTVDTEGDRR